MSSFFRDGSGNEGGNRFVCWKARSEGRVPARKAHPKTFVQNVNALLRGHLKLVPRARMPMLVAD